MLHGIHCIQSCCMESNAFHWDAFYKAALNSLHSINMHGIHCIQSGFILKGRMESSAFNQEPLRLDAWN